MQEFNSIPSRLPLEQRIDEALAQVKREIMRAKTKHPRDFSGPHEAYGVLLEEVDELWDEIKADHFHGSAQKEAMQVAAMAVRYMVEIPVRTDEATKTWDGGDRQGKGTYDK